MNYWILVIYFLVIELVKFVIVVSNLLFGYFRIFRVKERRRKMKDINVLECVFLILRK